MTRASDEQEFRLRPRKPRIPREERAQWAAGCKRVLHYARTSRGGAGRAPAKSRSGVGRPHFQRCAVRVSYARNGAAGQWRAHGRYVARESATFQENPKAVGFDESRRDIDVAAKVAEWQSAGDARLWKIILSPEFGDRVDLERLTRDVLKQVAADVRFPLEWAAAAHHNTGHPHVHVAVRGRTAAGQPLQFAREYVQIGMREIAEACCTRQLGYRTSLDAAEAERREVGEKRFTSLDRRILHEAPGDDAGSFRLIRKRSAIQQDRISARLSFLATMGLAESPQPNVWDVRRDFAAVLRAMQRIADRQKTLANYGVPISDGRLPVVVLDWREADQVEGRILVHGEEETSGRGYLMLEGTDARIHFIYYTPEMERLRYHGRLRTNSFVRLQKTKIQELGDAEVLLGNGARLAKLVRESGTRGVVPGEDGWGGWLGRYQAALCRASSQVATEVRKEAGRDRGR